MPVDIEKAGDNVEKASSFFDKLNAFIRRHPIWFGIILICGFVYWASNLPEEVAEEVVNTQEQRYGDEHNNSYFKEYQEVEHFHEDDEYYITKETFFVDGSGYREGDTVYVDYYSDGYVEMYYASNGESYYAD